MVPSEEWEAEALAASESPYSDWPDLSVKNILDNELMLLWGILRGKNTSSLGDISEPLPLSSDPEGPEERGEGGVSVSRVETEFIAALAALEKPDIDRVAVQWQRCEGLDEWPLAEMELAGALRDFVEFAQRAIREEKPVLSLFVW